MESYTITWRGRQITEVSGLDKHEWSAWTNMAGVDEHDMYERMVKSGHQKLVIFYDYETREILEKYSNPFILYTEIFLDESPVENKEERLAQIKENGEFIEIISHID